MVSYPQFSGFENIVSVVNWHCKGSDGTYIGEFARSTSIEFDSNTQYITYSDLTEDQVIAWVKKTLGEDGVASIYTIIDNQITAAAKVPTILPNPWGE